MSRILGFGAAALLTASGARLRAQSPSPLSQAQITAQAALRAAPDGQLPDGYRVRDEPVVANVGSNTIFRFGIEYHGVKLAAGSDYMAVVQPRS